MAAAPVTGASSGPTPGSTTRPAGEPSAPAGSWWTGAIGYQIYIRSFRDASGDGIGDLEGVRQGLPHLAELGVDYLWITPFYPSPQADHGYDVADYTDVDPVYGTLDGLDAVLRDAHGLGLRVIIDLVPNHTSDRHPWFRGAIRSPQAGTRDYYVWRDPAPDGGPPNNWVSKFGGPAWTLDAPTGQYYMHTFLPEQPDLNWANPQVRDEFDAILRFWLERGVDGFRIDTAHLLTEDPAHRDNPRIGPPSDPTDPESVYASFDHRHDLDQPDVVDVYRRWHRVVEPYGAMLLGEVFLLSPERVQRYVDDGALDLAFYFPALKTGWDAQEIRAAIGPAAVRSDRFVWPLSSHDDPRATQRFGGGGSGARRSLAYLTVLVGLPGGTCVLQGDELGLSADDPGQADRQDPIATRNPGAAGRDRSRTPVPWEPGPAFGFTTGSPWMPFPQDTSVAATVAAQWSDRDSTLHRTRRLLAVRRGLVDLCGAAPVQWLTEQGPVVAYRRGDTVVALNTAAQPRALALSGMWQVRYSSADRPATTPDGLVVPADTAVIVEVGAT